MTDLLHLADRDANVIFDVRGTGWSLWKNEWPESADGRRLYPPTNEKCLGLIADDGRFFAVRLVYGDDLTKLAREACDNADLRLAREYEERSQPGPDDYHHLFGQPPVIAPTRARTR